MKLYIIKLSARAPRRAEGETRQYVVYPLSLTRITDTNSDGVITGVETMKTASNIVAVDYINIAGMHSSQPWSGVNIMVTRYSDGTTITKKVIQ